MLSITFVKRDKHKQAGKRKVKRKKKRNRPDPFRNEIPKQKLENNFS